MIAKAFGLSMTIVSTVLPPAGIVAGTNDLVTVGGASTFSVALAAAAIAGRPDLVIVKEIEGFVRGRAAGEVPELIRSALLAQGYPATAINVEANEIGAVRHALAWARAGDVAVLPVHALAARAATLELIDALVAKRWSAGEPLP